MTLRFAHESWFDHGIYPTDCGFAAESLTLAFLASHPELNVAEQIRLIYGAMLAVLVYGSHPQLRPAVSALLPPGLAPRRRPAPVPA